MTAVIDGNRYEEPLPDRSDGYEDTGRAVVIAYSDGEVRRQFNVCFTARVVGGRLAISDESTELRFVRPEGIDQLPMHHTQRLRLRHFLEHRERPYLG